MSLPFRTSGLFRGDDEGYGTICAGMRKRHVVRAFAGFVAAGALSVQGVAPDRQRKTRNQFGVGHIHVDVPSSRYLRVVFAHFDGVVKRHGNLPMLTRQASRFRRSQYSQRSRNGYSSETGDSVGFGRTCFKYWQEPGDFQCLPQLWAEVSEHKPSAFGFCLSMYFDECAEPGAVNKVDVLKANDNLCGAGQEKIVNRCAKPVAFSSEHKTTAERQKINSICFTLRYFQRHRSSSSCANP
jgi:hypothetical protein